MSMTREEVIATLEESKRQNKIMIDNPTTFWASHQMADGVKNAKRRIEAFEVALTALRPVSRDQVEKVWRGVWVHTHSSDNFWTEVWKCSHCDFEDNYGECFDFCPFCGAAQTDEAVQMVMERLEGLYGEKEDG